MLNGRYYLDRRQARLCRLAAWVFLIVAVLRAMPIILPLASADAATLQFSCSPAGCGIAGRPDRLLPDEIATLVNTSPGAIARFADYVGTLSVRLGLSGAALLDGGPIVLLLLHVAMTMRQLGNGGDDDLARALPWLRRASIAALAAALLTPIGGSIRTMVLLPGTPFGRGYYFGIDVNAVLMNLLYAFAAFTVSWALAAGSRARRDIAEIV